jgi:YhcH/YjgK/YiaL family protein
MIFDSINNLKLYTGLGSDFKAVCDFVAGKDFEKMAAARYDFVNGIYYTVQNYKTRSESEALFETHRKYIDLQYMVKGRERHYVTHVSALKPNGEYNEERDMDFYDGEGDSLVLKTGFFVIYFPDDGHKPNISLAKDPENIIKVVFKIPVRS